MRPLATEKNLQFEIIRSQPLPEFIRTDSTRLKQCLINLVSSAVRFTDRGYVYVRVFWDNSGSNPFIRFDVEYTQSVLSSERQYRVFGRSGAACLGLTITQRLAEFLEGSVTIGSTTGKGSVFTLTIPTGMPPEPQATAARRVDAAAKKLSAQMVDSLKLGGRVLVAEDSPTNQALVELLLKKLGVEVVIVENGQLAVQKVMEEKFDVILMDIQMPVMNGYEATNQLRKNGVKIPIIALTACAMKGDDEKCFAAGCSDYISKPIDRKKLVEIIMKYLAVKGLSPDPSVAALAKTEALQKSPAAGVVQPSAAAEIEIDWQLLNERIGSQELIDEIIPIFIKDNTERMKMLSGAVEKNDEREIKFYAHSIKGAAATIGATGISELARLLEAAVRDLDNSKYKSIFEELSVRFTRLVDFLSKDDWKQAARQASSRQHT
jgi:CheY-like chemotaxis protein